MNVAHRQIYMHRGSKVRDLKGGSISSKATVVVTKSKSGAHTIPRCKRSLNTSFRKGTRITSK